MNCGRDSVFDELIDHGTFVEKLLLVEVTPKPFEFWVLGAIISVIPLIVILVYCLHVSWLRKVLQVLPLRFRAQCFECFLSLGIFLC